MSNGYVKVWDDTDCSGYYLVEYNLENGDLDISERFTARWKAEKRAGQIAKQQGCDWGTNY